MVIKFQYKLYSIKNRFLESARDVPDVPDPLMEYFLKKFRTVSIKKEPNFSFCD